MGGLPDFVKAIALKQQARRVARLRALRAARDGRSAEEHEQTDQGSRRQAGAVRVLIGANMPSVLAEMGFVTNPQEAKLLKANAYRQKDRRVAVQRHPQV